MPTLMLARNKVEDFDRWRRVSDAQTESERAGMRLMHMWRAVDDPQTVWFLLELPDVEAAKAHVNDPTSAQIGQQAGVLHGEIWYVEPVA